MRSRLRNDLALFAAVIALGGATLAVVVGRVDMGFAFGQNGDLTRVVDVRPNSPAAVEGFQPGMIVLSINGNELLRLPALVYPEQGGQPGSTEPTPTPEATATPEATTTPEPSAATATPTSAAGPSASAEPGQSAATTPIPSASAAQATPGAAASAPPAAPSMAGSSPSLAPIATTPPPAPTPTPVASAASGPSATPTSDTGEPAGGPVDGQLPGPTPYLDPPVPTVVSTSGAALGNMIGRIDDLQAIPANALETPPSGDWNITYLGRSYGHDLDARIPALFAGALILLAAFLFGGLLGPSLRSLAIPLAAATAVPLLAAPLVATWWAPAVALAGVLVPLGMAPLGDALSERISDPDARRTSRLTILVCLTAAVVLGLLRPALDPTNGAASLVAFALAAAIPLVPGLAMVATARAHTPLAGAIAGSGPVASTELLVAGGTPVAALMTAAAWNSLLLPLSAWLAGIAIAGRLTVRPLSRLLSRATLQRDLVVAATEAERARVAADIHDDALQDLTMLVRRLDGAGDTEGAEMARGVIARLRAILGDLRLPVLDDLGVGPALDWLVERVEGASGGDIRLEHTDAVRPPRDVELAFFRVAQEALRNATRHGKPPIVVRYHASDAGATLSVDDAGPGIDPGAAEAAEHAGRFGLLNMRQRADQIGAILDVRPWPGGGTHVGLQWRPH